MFTLKIQHYEIADIYSLELHEDNQEDFKTILNSPNKETIKKEFLEVFRNIDQDWFHCSILYIQHRNDNWFAQFEAKKEFVLETK